jgi:acyl-coenzyme A thioesterase 13
MTKWRMTTAQIPDGFVPLFRSSPFLESVGNFYFAGLGADMRIGVFVEPRATNLRGVAHGGFLSALCDVALGYALSTSQTPTARLVTASLSVEFAGAAKVGDWVETSVDIQHLGRQLGFASAYLYVARKRIVHASGVFARPAEGEP